FAAGLSAVGIASELSGVGDDEEDVVEFVGDTRRERAECTQSFVRFCLFVTPITSRVGTLSLVHPLPPKLPCPSLPRPVVLNNLSLEQLVQHPALGTPPSGRGATVPQS